MSPPLAALELLPRQALQAATSSLLPILKGTGDGAGTKAAYIAKGACWGGPSCRCAAGGQIAGPNGPCLWFMAIPVILLVMGLTTECGASISLMFCMAMVFISILLGEFSSVSFIETEGLAYYFAGLKSGFLGRGPDTVSVAACGGTPYKKTQLFLSGEVDLTFLEPTPAMCGLSNAVLILLLVALVLGGFSVLAASVAALTSDSGREACTAQLASLGYLVSSAVLIAASVTWLFAQGEFASIVDKGFASVAIDPKPKSSVSVSFWMIAQTSLVMLVVASSYSYASATKVKEERDRRRQQEMREHQIVEMRATLF